MQGKQADLRLRQGRADEARNLLQTALPVMRDAFLPGQVDRNVIHDNVRAVDFCEQVRQMLR